MESNGEMEIKLKIRLSKNKIICDVIEARDLLPSKNDRLWSPCVKIQVIKTSSEKQKCNRPFILSPRTKNIQENAVLLFSKVFNSQIIYDLWTFLNVKMRKFYKSVKNSRLQNSP